MNETINGNHPSGFWHSRRVCLMRQHGAGFLGSFVVDKMRQHGAKDVFVPRRADYDLVQAAAIRRLLSHARPDVVIHLPRSAAQSVPVSSRLLVLEPADARLYMSAGRSVRA